MSKLLHKAVRQKSESAFSVYQQHLANRPVNVSAEVIYYFSSFSDILLKLLKINILLWYEVDFNLFFWL